jgi:cytochrome c-type biogenesis protein CcmE
MLPRHKRLIAIVTTLIGVTIAISLILRSFQDNLLYYLTPSEAIVKNLEDQRAFRIGGLVEMGSFQREEGNLKARFILTDGIKNIEVNYSGILPDLFREGQGIIATGTFNQEKIFIASEVLAKHDENYMPPNIQPLKETSS